MGQINPSPRGFIIIDQGRTNIRATPTKGIELHHLLVPMVGGGGGVAMGVVGVAVGVAPMASHVEVLVIHEEGMVRGHTPSTPAHATPTGIIVGGC
jgi:hypothetical protein